MKNRKVMALVMAAAMLVGNSTFVSADSLKTDEPMLVFETVDENGVHNTYSYPLSECGSETYDADGNLISSEDHISVIDYTIKNSKLAPGCTKSYFPSNNKNGFSLTKNNVVTVSLKLSEAARIKTYLGNGSGLETTDKKPKVQLVPYATQRMKLYIKNISGKSITVNGSISW